jgi:TBC1 domain family member 6
MIPPYRDQNQSQSPHEGMPGRSPSNNGGSREPRESVRSIRTTTSSHYDTMSAGTERSSVATKSSATSDFYTPSSRPMIHSRDPSIGVDDVLGWYEYGDDDEDDFGPSPRPSTSDGRLHTREFSDIPEVPDLYPQRGGSMASPNQKSPNSLSPSMQPQSSLSPLKLSPSNNSEGPTPSPLFPPADWAAPALQSVASSSDYRDRYGFRISTQYVSMADFESWATKYGEDLQRRKKKWDHYMHLNNLPSRRPKRFPERSAKLKRYVRKGIPPEWRGEAWFWFAGGQQKLLEHPDVYKDLIAKAERGEIDGNDVELIERDLQRTFPDNIYFKPEPVPLKEGETESAIPPETKKLKALRRVLQAFSIYVPRIGYCQSLNYIAGLLLLFMPEERAFWMLHIITHDYLPGTHSRNLEGASVDLGVLMMSIQESLPSIWAKVGGELDGGIADTSSGGTRLAPIALCISAWFMSCFIGNLPIECVLRVWDSFFYEGSKTIFRIALAVFKLGEPQIKACTDPMEIFQIVQIIPRKMYDAGQLMEQCYKRRNGFGHLSQETIEKRREERRGLYAQERARKGLNPNGDSGSVRENGPNRTRTNTDADQSVRSFPQRSQTGDSRSMFGRKKSARKNWGDEL